MLGEASVAVSNLRNEIMLLEEERDNYILANEGRLPETIYSKQLAEYQERIDTLQASLRSWVGECRDTTMGINNDAEATKSKS